MFYGVCVSCRILYSIVTYLYVSCSGSITSAGEERANESAIVYLCGFCSKRFPLPLGAWDGLRSLMVAPLSLPSNYFVLEKPYWTSDCGSNAVSAVLFFINMCGYENEIFAEIIPLGKMAMSRRPFRFKFRTPVQ